MLIYVLAIHLMLAAGLALLVIGRIIKLVVKQSDQLLRKLFYYFSASLVVSGVALSGIGKLPIATICLESLGLVVGLALADLGLSYFSKKIEDPVRVKED